MIARILVADDDPAVRAMLRDFLESRRHHVLEASDGAQAFMLAEKEMPHLIIMDIVMPGLYGNAAAKRIQEYWRTSKIPIIVISGSADAPVRPQAGGNSRIRFLRKPVDLAALEKAIAELLPHGGYTP